MISNLVEMQGKFFDSLIAGKVLRKEIIIFIYFYFICKDQKILKYIKNLRILIIFYFLLYFIK